MSDAFSKITAILLCVCMMFIIPVFYMREESERLKQTYVLEEITLYVDGIRNTGILSMEDYDRLEAVLFNIGGGYRIEMSHSTHLYDEEGATTEYYATTNYTAQIIESFDNGNDYYLKKNDYLRVVVYDRKNAIIAWYGGSVRYEAY